MKFTIVMLLLSIYLFSCQENKKPKQLITISIDEFPKIKLDSIQTDSAGFGKLLSEKLKKSQADSIDMVIDCKKNAVLPALESTMKLANTCVANYKGDAKLKAYNKCLEEMKLFLREHGLKKDLKTISAKALGNGILMVNGQNTTVEAFCKLHHGQKIKLILSADSKLSTDQFTSIFDQLNKEKFQVILKVDRSNSIN